jgi:hypothetical protein
MMGPFFFEATVACTSYLTMLQDIIILCINSLFSDEDRYFQHDGILPHPRLKFSACSFPGIWKL